MGATISQFASNLDQAYSAAIKEYRQAINLTDAWQAAKGVVSAAALKTAVKYSLPGVAYAIAKRYLPE